MYLCCQVILFQLENWVGLQVYPIIYCAFVQIILIGDYDNRIKCWKIPLLSCVLIGIYFLKTYPINYCYIHIKQLYSLITVVHSNKNIPIGYLHTLLRWVQYILFLIRIKLIPISMSFKREFY